MALDNEAVREALGNAIASALPGEITTRWVTLVETMDEDGEVGIWLMCPAGQKAWHTLGMLRHAEHMEQAATVRAALDD